jgi:UDP-glucose 4-epimerase
VQGRFDVSTVSTLNDEWQKTDYSIFDSIVFVAGIAHRRQKKKNKDLYFTVNRDLAVSVAEKAKAEGAGQFVYFSSMSVYGIRKGEIAEHTIPTPNENDSYGMSKFQAEKLIEPMRSDEFRIAIIRPPMVYGPNCKGKFPLLVKLAKKFPFIPTIQNSRSMIYIENLSELLAIVVEQNVAGMLCPQNKEYVSTVKMIEEISKVIGKKKCRLPALNLLIYLCLPFLQSLQSAFGSLYYSGGASKMHFKQKYQIVDFEQSIRKSIEA